MMVHWENKMADLLLWLGHGQTLFLFFIVSSTWTHSMNVVLNINTNGECLQYVVCKQDLGNQSWFSPFIISSNDVFALGKAVHSAEGNIVLVSSPSSCRPNYTCAQECDRQDLNMCSVECYALLSKQRDVSLQSIYSFTKARRQSLFDTLSPNNRQWNIILKGVRSLLSEEKWKTNILFTSSHEELSVISSGIQSSTSKLLLFTMDEDVHLNQTLHELYKLLEKEDLNFIIACSVACIVEFLSQVYQYENVIGKTSNTWLVITTEGSAGDIVTTSMQVSNADIVVIELPACTKEHSSFSVPWNTSSVSANVYTLHSSQNGKKLQHVGSLSQDGSLSVSEDLFPGFKYGLKNQTLTVSTLEWPPFVIKQDVNGSVTYTGVCMDLLQELSRSLNFSYKIVEPEDGEWGRVLDGRWTGLIGQLAYKKVDLLAAPIAIMEARENVMDFTVPYFFVQASIILKNTDGNANKWMTLLTPFRYEVHICILVSLIFSTIFLFAVQEVHPANTWADNRLTTRMSRYGDIVWSHIGAVVKNGWLELSPLANTVFVGFRWLVRRSDNGDVLEGYSLVYEPDWRSKGVYILGGSYLPTTNTGRSIFGCWLFFTMVSAAIYSGNLIAFLTAWREEQPFSSLAEMVEQDVYKWGTIGGSSYITLFQSSNQSVFRKIWQGLQTEPDLTSLDIELHKNKVLDGQYAYIGDETLMELWLAEHCELHQLLDPFHFMNYAIGLPNNSAYTNLFSTQMLRINELGLPREWYKRWNTNAQCDASRSVKRVDLLALQSAFYAAGVGVLLAIVVMMAELMWNVRQQNQRHQV